MINTFQKTFGKKNFFFSFYTAEIKPIIEQYISTIPDDEQLFPLGTRYIQKEFEKTSKKRGIKITPKMIRKFARALFILYAIVGILVLVIKALRKSKILSLYIT